MASRFSLVSLAGDRTVDLPAAGLLVVGRVATADLTINDPTISRQHAEIQAGEGGVRFRDLGSSNGTFLNGQQVVSGEAGPGDVVTFGKVAFRVVGEVARLPVPEPPPPLDATILRQLPVAKLGIVTGLDLERTAPEGGAVYRTPGLDEGARREKKLALLLEVAKGLGRQVGLEPLLEKIVEFSFQVLNVDRVSLQLMAAGENELRSRLSRSRSGSTDVLRHVPRSITRKAVEERVAILSSDASADLRFVGQSVLMQSVRSAMCTPLVASSGEVLGVLYVDNQTAVQSFDDEDLEFLAAFGSLAAVAIESSRMEDRLRAEALKISNFQRFFAPAVAERIARETGEVRLQGERRDVVVLFSDIRGFTAMSETMPPESVAALLNEYFTGMVDIVFDHGGTLDKFIGDAMLAQWGAPISREDDADRALACALDQMAALERLGRKWGAEGKPPIAIGIGINFGPCFAGNIGSVRRLEYTVIGDAVNTASRLCSAAGRGEILVSAAFRERLRLPFDFEALDPIRVKGKAQPLEVFRVRTS
jgi:adenylate cyclase